MSGIADQLLVGATIAGALAFFIVRAIRRRRAREKSCNAGCGCSPPGLRKRGQG
jgi:hypothetical protein